MLLNIIVLGLIIVPFVFVWSSIAGILENVTNPNTRLALQIIRIVLMIALVVYFYKF